MSGDIIDLLAGIAPGSALDSVRRLRSEARQQAQASFTALFAPPDAGAMALTERTAVALFLARLHDDAPAEALYSAMLAAAGGAGLAAPVRAEANGARVPGPYGHYPAGVLSAEGRDGPNWRVGQPWTLGARVAAALEHTHMLVFHPRDAAPHHLRALVDAGWGADGIVTLSQLVAFLSFQIRVAVGLRAMMPVPA